jgi:hypothetical protein
VTLPAQFVAGTSGSDGAAAARDSPSTGSPINPTPGYVANRPVSSSRGCRTPPWSTIDGPGCVTRRGTPSDSCRAHNCDTISIGASMPTCRLTLSGVESRAGSGLLCHLKVTRVCLATTR